jgi:hypothetical protein
MGEAIEVKWLVVFGHTQLVVTNTLFFLRNCRIVTAEEVQSIRKTVLVDTCKVLFNKVLLTGRLRKEVTFREPTICPGNVGAVGSALAEVGFQAMIDVSGARPGDSCVVVKAFVEGEDEKPLTSPGGGIRGLVESSVVFLCVKVVRMAMRNHDHSGDDRSDSSSSDDNSSHDSGEDDSCRTDSITKSSSSADACSSSDSGQVDPHTCWESGSFDHHRHRKDRHCKGCPKRKTTGLVVTGENGKVPDAQPGTTPGSFVGPTILFPGFI